MKRLLIVGSILLIAGFGAFQFGAGAVTPYLYSGTVLQTSTPAPALEGMSFSDGTQADLAAYVDDVVLLYFGYTNCPAVCPTALASVATALRDMDGAERDRVHLLMVSVDPERDSPDELQSYVEFFDPTFAGLSGSRENIDSVASQYGVFYELGEGTPETGYVVDHTATMLGIDTGGALRVVWPPTASGNDLQRDIEELLTK